jgi:hypothetical protein
VETLDAPNKISAELKWAIAMDTLRYDAEYWGEARASLEARKLLTINPAEANQIDMALGAVLIYEQTVSHYLELFEQLGNVEDEVDSGGSETSNTG